METSVLGLTTFDRICELSRNLCNCDPQEVGMCPDLVYIATHSLGERRVELVAPNRRPVHEIPDPSHGNWNGFKKDDIRSVEWVSGGSGATLVAWFQKETASWWLQYDGVEDATCESRYLVHFYEAVDKGSIEALSMNESAVRALRATLADSGAKQDILAEVCT